MKKVLGRVVALLKSDPDLRDDVILTRKRIWEEDLMKLGKSLHFIYASELLELEQKGSLTNAESIRRMWQIAQQKNSELRGKKYDSRHGKKQDETKAEIKHIGQQVETEAGEHDQKKLFAA